jgi:phospholipid/cholesterol/gamma-HCH transport system substrate-binding protein
MHDHGRIPVQNTEPDVNSDEVLSALDADTRSYLQLLVNGAGKGLRGRGGDLRAILRRYEPLHRDVARVASAFAARKRDLAELVHDYGALMSELGDRSGDLSRLVTAANQTFGAFASQENQIASAVALFPPALRSSSAALASVRRLTGVLPPALNALRSPARTLADTNAKLIPAAKEGTPILANQVRPFVRAARPYVTNLRPAARDLNVATPDLTAVNHEFNRFFNIAAYNPGGAQKLTGDPAKDRARDEGLLYWLSWGTQNGSSLFSTSDASGPFRRIQLVASCSTWRDYVNKLPASEVVFGLTGLLRDPKLCGSAP